MLPASNKRALSGGCGPGMLQNLRNAHSFLWGYVYQVFEEILKLLCHAVLIGQLI